MTYGGQLDDAARALIRVNTALRRATPGRIVDHEAAAIARTRLYRALERQVAYRR